MVVIFSGVVHFSVQVNFTIGFQESVESTAVLLLMKGVAYVKGIHLQTVAV